MNSDLPDHDLTEKILKGDNSAFKLLYERHKRNVFLTCLRYAKDKAEAEDFMQDSFILIYNKLKSFDPNKGQFRHWSNRVTINACLSKLRTQSFKFTFSNLTDLVKVPKDSSFDIFDHLSLQEVTKVIQRLPDGYRTVFNLYVIDGYTHKEIAAELNISENTSKSQLFKARKHLLKMLSQNGLEVKYG